MKKIMLMFFITAVLFCTPLQIFAAEDSDTVYESDITEQTEANYDTEAETAENTDAAWHAPTTLEGWEAYIKDELLPIIVAALSIVAAIYVAISPILAKIKKASERFKAATEDVNAATGQVKSNKDEIERMERELKEKIELIEKENADNHERLMDIEEMICEGLGNMDELVIKGTARRIAKIGERPHSWHDGEQTESTEESEENDDEAKA